MDFRQSPLLLGFSLGRWFRTDVRVSFLFPLVLLMLCLQLGWRLGGLVSLILIVSILIHEFAHVFGARQTGGGANEILLWPLGGLAMTSPAYSFRSQFWTVAAGPTANLMICLLMLPLIWRWNVLWECVQLILLPPVELQSATLARDAVLLTFAVNFRLLVINLLPIYPLDGGQLALVVAKRYRDGMTARQGVMWSGIIVCILLMAIGAVTKTQELMFLSCILVLFVFHEFYMLQMQPRDEESFLGYDFSQGYTSLERAGEAEERAVQTSRPGPLQRWKEKREEERRLREDQERAETERRLDELLQKVHEQGMNSLSDSERSFLTKASARYRSPDRPS